MTRFLPVIVIFGSLPVLYAQTAPPPMPILIAPPPMPPPSSTCKMVAQTYKYVGFNCTTADDCGSSIDPYGDTYLCKNGKCICGPDAMETVVINTMGGSNFTGCVRKPNYAGASCTTECAKPYTCAVVNTTTPVMTIQVMASSNTTTPVPRPIAPPVMIKQCQCLAPYRTVGSQCSKVCQPNEIQLTNGDCRKRCQVDEIVDANNECKKAANLDQPCESDGQCTVSFSQCINGLCKCKENFTADGGKCTTTAYSCPHGGEAVRVDGAVMTCKIMRSLDPFAAVMQPTATGHTVGVAQSFGVEDTCGSDKYCFVNPYPNSLQYTDGDSGYCCTKPIRECPIGKPYAASPTCAGSLYGDIPTNTHSLSPSNIVIGSDSCPKTHECIMPLLPLDPPLCCPRVCNEFQIYVNGRCYQMRQFGDSCQVNEQCRNHYGICNQGNCTCGPNYATVVANGPDGSQAYCSRVCAYNEFSPASNLCAPKLKMGQQCSKKQIAPCPNGAVCNDQGICACQCGFQQITDDLCGPPPQCPQRNVSSNPTYCKTKPPPIGSTPFSSAVDQCPDGQVCVRYHPAAGLCCPVPTFECPGGSTKNLGPCNYNSTSPCPSGASCARSFTPANDEDFYKIGTCCLSTPVPAVPISASMPPAPAPMPPK